MIGDTFPNIGPWLLGGSMIFGLLYLAALRWGPGLAALARRIFRTGRRESFSRHVPPQAGPVPHSSPARPSGRAGLSPVLVTAVGPEGERVSAVITPARPGGLFIHAAVQALKGLKCGDIVINADRPGRGRR